jgi:AAA15 family ATPase/GTPase
MIHSLSIQNFLSFKEVVTFSFEATKDKKLDDFHVVEVAKGVRLLKLGIIYGANASGKSNLINAFEFLKDFWFTTIDSKDENTGVIPFLLDAKTSKKPSKFKLVFFVGGIKYLYILEISENFVLFEKLDYYPGTQPANIFERKLENNVSKIIFGPKIKVSQIAKNEIAIKCLPNMSFFAAYNQVNTLIKDVHSAIDWMSNQFMDTVEPKTRLVNYVEGLISENSEIKENILSYLQRADFNISNVNVEIEKEDIPDFFISNILESNVPTEEKERIKKERTINVTKTTFEHKVINEDQAESYFSLPIELQSEGTLRIFGLSGAILTTLKRNAFLAIDEIESKLHPRLIEFVIERFLRESEQAQLLVTTHYDGLLEEDDLLRKDNIWFTEKNKDASTNLYSLSDFKAVNRITSLQKAYKFGKFGAIPNIE